MVHLAAFHLQARSGNAHKAIGLRNQGTRLRHHTGPVQLAQRGQIRCGIAQIGELNQALHTGIYRPALRLELVKMAQPFTALDGGGFVPAGQRQQGFEFAHPQIGPK